MAVIERCPTRPDLPFRIRVENYRLLADRRAARRESLVERVERGCARRHRRDVDGRVEFLGPFASYLTAAEIVHMYHTDDAIDAWIVVTCPTCAGDGERCPSCEGEGAVTLARARELEASIEQGWDRMTNVHPDEWPF